MAQGVCDGGVILNPHDKPSIVGFLLYNNILSTNGRVAWQPADKKYEGFKFHL
jgi:hypothetical protein